MRKTLAVSLIFVLTMLVAAAPLMACPFVQGQKACCRRTSSQAPRCPLAPSLERCPFYLTEAKIGVAEAKVVSLPLALAVSSVAPMLPVSQFVLEVRHDRLSDQAGAYLLNRVLRI